MFGVVQTLLLKESRFAGYLLACRGDGNVSTLT
uniref:Uncharacterized protein n=1 Tax=Myoviridae sp. ct3Sw5 TaxID=2826609 RepID=A0A8S5MPA0_9CAUD|nr:MAG TPA: hypothetical protein [Myoviridae sp. ct3Sw5]